MIKENMYKIQLKKKQQIYPFNFAYKWYYKLYNNSKKEIKEMINLVQY